MKEWSVDYLGRVIYPMGVKMIIKDLIQVRLDEAGLTTKKGYCQRIMWKSAYISSYKWWSDTRSDDKELVIWVNVSYINEKEVIRDAWRSDWQTERITFRFGVEVIREYKLNQLLKN